MKALKQRWLIVAVAWIGGFTIGAGIGFWRSADVSRPSSVTAANAISEARSLSSGGFATNEDAAKALFTANHEREPLRRSFEIVEIARRLNAGQTAELVMRVHKIGGDLADELLPTLLAHWVELDPERANAWMAPFIRRTLSSSSDNDRNLLLSWANANPEGFIEDLVARPYARAGSVYLIEAVNALADGDLIRKLDYLSGLPASLMRDRSMAQFLDDEIDNDPQFVLDQLWRMKSSQQFDNLRQSALSSLATKAPKEALAGLDELAPSPGAEGRAERLFKEVESHIAREEPREVLKWLAKQPEAVAEKARASLAIGWARKEPVAALEWAVQNGVALEGGGPGDAGSDRLIDAAIRTDPKAVFEWIKKQPQGDERDRLLLAAAGSVDTKTASAILNELPVDDQVQLGRTVAQQLGSKDGAELTQWLQGLPTGPVRQQTISVAALRQADRGGLSLEELESRYAAGPDRDAALHGSAVGFARNEVRSALEMAQRIQDGNVREVAFWEVARVWSQSDLKGAADWIQSTTALSAQSKATLIRFLQEERR